MLNTPILLICFNRPDRVRTALSEILKQNPTELYISQDGPREGNEIDRQKCAEVRQTISEMVGCEELYTGKTTLHTTHYTLHFYGSSVNLGCGRGPYEAMSWFFSQVEYGIILEDDIIPHPLFFEYMDDLLVRYKDDMRIGMVTGHNLERVYYGNASYYFTNRMSGTLGWGTWSRVWKKFDFNIAYDHYMYEDVLKNFYHIPPILRQRSHAFQQKWLSGNRHDCWDFQFDYFLLVNKYLNAHPNSCLTSHDGNDGNGTHTYYNPNYYMDVHEERFTPIIHPKSVAISKYVRLDMWKREIRAFARKCVNLVTRKK